MNYKPIIIIFICIILLQFLKNPTLTINAVLEGINLWFYNVLPSLFPFMIFSNILFLLDTATYLQKLFNRIMNKIYNVSGCGILPLIMGYISGYPMGAKLVCDLRKNNYISNFEGYKLLSICSTTGPAFIIGIVSIQMFKNPSIAPILLVSNYMGAIINGFVIKKFYKEKIDNNSILVKHEKEFSNILNDSIINSINAILKIGGYIVFFMILLSYFNSIGLLTKIVSYIYNNLNLMNLSEKLLEGIVYGFFEITIAINTISMCNDTLLIKVAITSFIIAWSGFSILLQTNSFLLETDFKLGKYMLIKFSQSVFSMLISIITFKLFYKEISSVFNNFNYIEVKMNSNLIEFYYFVFLILTITIVIKVINKK